MSIAADIIKNYLTSPEAPPEIKDTINRIIESITNVDADGAAQTEVDSIQTNIDTIESDLDIAEAAIVVLDAALTALVGAYTAHDHSVGDPTQVDHPSLTGVTTDQHHDQMHPLSPAEGEGITPQHTGPLPESYVVFDDAAGHAHETGAGGKTVDHGHLGGVGADDHHAEVHDLAGAKHNADTFANVDSKVSDKSLAKLQDAQTFSGQKTFSAGAKVSEIDEAAANAGYLLKNAKGIGASDGQAIVFADKFAGANMGAKIQAAITALSGTGGKIIIPPGAHVCTDAGGGYAVDLTSDIEIEFLKGAVLTANGDFKAFNIGAAITDVIFRNPHIHGSNTAAHNNNIGINLASGAKHVYIFSPYLYQLERGISDGISCEDIQVIGGKIVECTSIGVFLSGDGNLICGVHAHSNPYGFVLRGRITALGCFATSGGHGFYLANQAASRILVEACQSISNNTGFIIHGAAGSYQYVTLKGCLAQDNASYGISAGMDVVTGLLSLVLVGNQTVCTTTQTYAFRFFRDVKKLIFVGNNTGGYSTAAEFWHAALDKADFEIGHNYEG